MLQINKSPGFVNFRKSNVAISGKPEFKVTQNREGITVYLGYGNNRYIRFRLNPYLDVNFLKSLDFNIFRLKGSFKMSDYYKTRSYSAGPPTSSYGGIYKEISIRILSKNSLIMLMTYTIIRLFNNLEFYYIKGRTEDIQSDRVPAQEVIILTIINKQMT